jgi:hypothetical protein
MTTEMAGGGAMTEAEDETTDAKTEELAMHIMLMLDKAPHELRETVAEAYDLTLGELSQCIETWKARRQ